MPDVMQVDAPAEPPRGTCPICQKPSDPVLRPFCSKRCADIDLHRWLNGSYRVPAEDEPDDDEAHIPAGDPPMT